MKPYDYQQEISRLLLSGQNLVLQAPTGAGKTRAALLPFLHAWAHRQNFPAKCVYVVPMRVLAHQFFHEYSEVAESYARRYRRKPKVAILTGDQPNDRRFEADLIFCTIDQFLSSFLNMPYSLPNRWANLNAGAFVGSYLVFDEFHLLDPDSTLPSSLYAIRQLSQVAPVLLMTATFSTSMLDALAAHIGAKSYLVSTQEAEKIETRDYTISRRQRTWQASKAPLNAQAVLELHRARSLVLCNTVRRAQQIFRELRSLVEKDHLDIQLLLLHSRFLVEDRRRIETQLRDQFGKESDGTGSWIAVATQTIEVGVDISCEILHSELAPASSLIQRAGRCARYPGQRGQVIVYPVESFMPYGREKPDNPTEEEAWVQEMRNAYNWLQGHHDEMFDFAKEQAFVDAVATPRDQAILASISSGRHTRATEIHRVLEGERQGQDQRILVRDADSRLILIHPEPDVLLKNPHAATGFSLPHQTLYGFVNDWRNRSLAEEPEWRILWLHEQTATKTDSKDSNRTEYLWRPLVDNSLLAVARVLVVSPELAGYRTDEGFVPDVGNTDFISTLPFDAAERTWERTQYQLESYEEHLRHVLAAFAELALPELDFPAQALEHKAGWQPGIVRQAAWLTVWLHDVGKLSVGWQRWARAYQRAVGRPVDNDFAVAHTDFDQNNPTHLAAAKAVAGKNPKPNHAGESALAVALMLASALGKEHEALVRAALTAIIRHHTPFAREGGAYQLEKQAARHLQATIILMPEEIGSRVNLSLLKADEAIPPTYFTNWLANPRDVEGWLAYTLLVRALRRADQEGTKRGVKVL